MKATSCGGILHLSTYRQWCDDESRRSSEVFVAVDVHRVGHSDDAVVQLHVPIVT